MTAEFLSKDAIKPAQGPAMEKHPGQSIRRMAVLFTDIVGSSKFFQKFGDVAGRRMLKRHEEVASQPILEHGGVVVKMLGDSIMAYFFQPREAVKCAVKIQQRFHSHNLSKGPSDQILVRIGVHFGEGIVEDGDIFGDVVNMAAKFLPFVQGNDVCISQAVFDQVQGLSGLHFEGFSTPQKDIFPAGFRMYRVCWEESLNLDPLMKTLVYFRPLFSLGKADFRRKWEKAIYERRKSLPTGVEKEALFSDGSLALIVQEPSLSLPAATRFVRRVSTLRKEPWPSFCSPAFTAFRTITGKLTR